MQAKLIQPDVPGEAVTEAKRIETITATVNRMLEFLKKERTQVKIDVRELET